MQISAVISDETIQQLEQAVKKRGLKKAYVIEAALQHHLMAMETIPEEFFIPPVVTLSDKGWKTVVDELTSDAAPTDALTGLLSND